MTSPAGPPDLSKLRINRDIPSAPVRRALGRNVAIGLVALVVVAVILMLGRGRAVTVQTAVATPIASGGQPGSAGESRILAESALIALVGGIGGRFFPAWRAARMPVVQALR